MITLFHYVTQRVYNSNMNKTTKPEWTRSLNVTEPEEAVLVEMITFFNDMGWINDDTQDAYDTLVDKVCDPSPFDYSVTE